MSIEKKRIASFKEYYETFKAQNPKLCDIMSQDELITNVAEEGFLTNHSDDDFARSVFKLILEEYVKERRGEFELNQIWKVFSQLDENGLNSEDEKVQSLYLRLAKEIVEIHNDSINTRDKTSFVLASLRSFDKTFYLFKSLSAMKNRKPVIEAEYAFYADFIEKVAPACSFEEVFYSVFLKELNAKKEYNGGWDSLAPIIESDANDYRAALSHCYHYENEVSQFEEHSPYRRAKSNLISEDGSIVKIQRFTDEEQQKDIIGYPVYLKKPSKRIFLPSTSLGNY